MDRFHRNCKEMSFYTSRRLHRWKRTRTYISIGSINKFTDPAATRSAVKSTACLDIRVHEALFEVSFSLPTWTRFVYLFLWYGAHCTVILFPGHRCFRDRLLYSASKRTFLFYVCSISFTAAQSEQNSQPRFSRITTLLAVCIRLSIITLLSAASFPLEHAVRSKV